MAPARPASQCALVQMSLPAAGEAKHLTVTTVGPDPAEKLFQVHGITPAGEVVFNKPLRRAERPAFFERPAPYLIGQEAGASGQYRARELSKQGQEVRPIPLIHVKPDVKRGKSDGDPERGPSGAAQDAEASLARPWRGRPCASCR
ncbi:hypothetical protein [Rhodovulum sp. MB263]|uniref:hypothetical protein n=1 Tax=Rhodovulum sp. (strain MB263) TaxID=308754 RepID=UPI001E37C0F8|nr:hypothetical protein [Rhodovulum sp. MB263]